MAKAQSVTSVEISPEQERKTRMVRYTWAMSIRVVCLVAGMFLQGWPMWIAFAGAIFLPYFAVVLANNVGSSKPAPKATAVVAAPLRVSAEDFRQTKPDSD